MTPPTSCACVFDATDGQDGRVSIEVAPRLAHNTTTTVAEAEQLAWLVDRENMLIIIPDGCRSAAGMTLRGTIRSSAAELTWRHEGKGIAIWDFNIELD